MAITHLDLERDIETAIVNGIRTVLTTDADFTYNKDMLLTKVLVSSAFPEDSADFKIPQIIVAVTGFELFDSSLYNNYAGDIIESGVSVGKRYMASIPYSATVNCFASKDGTCKDLINRVLGYMSFVAKDFFNSGLCLNISRFSKAQGGLASQSPQKSFTHSFGISGSLDWVGEVRTPSWPVGEMPPGESNIEILRKILMDLTNN